MPRTWPSRKDQPARIGFDVEVRSRGAAGARPNESGESTWLDMFLRAPVLVGVTMVMAVPEEVHQRTQEQEQVGAEPEHVAPVLPQDEKGSNRERRQQRQLRISGKRLTGSTRDGIVNAYVVFHGSRSGTFRAVVGAGNSGARTVNEPDEVQFLRGGAMPALGAARRSRPNLYGVTGERECRWQQVGNSARTNSTALAALSTNSDALATMKRLGWSFQASAILRSMAMA